VIPSISSEAKRITKVEVYQSSRQTHYRTENGTQIELLAKEHRELVFWLLGEARQSYAKITGRLSWLLLINSLFLISLAIITSLLYSGSRLTNPLLLLLFILSGILTAVLLAGSCAFALYGSVFTFPPGPTLSLPGEVAPRQKVLTLAQADLDKFRQAESKANFSLRWSAWLFLIALIAYFFLVIVLLL
jgi:hypothetical protein